MWGLVTFEDRKDACGLILHFFFADKLNTSAFGFDVASITIFTLFTNKTRTCV